MGAGALEERGDAGMRALEEQQKSVGSAVGGD